MEQKQIHKQWEALACRPHVRHAARLASYPLPLQLTEPLQICLLAVDSRYPKHSLDINEAVLGLQCWGAEGWRALDLIELLQETVPQLLQAMACLEVTLQRKGIYLLEYFEEIPAFWVHCGEDGERMPVYQGNLAVRQAHRHDEALEINGAPGHQLSTANKWVQRVKIPSEQGK